MRVVFNLYSKLRFFNFNFDVEKLQFLIQYHKFPITVGPNFYVTGSKYEVENIYFNVW